MSPLSRHLTMAFSVRKAGKLHNTGPLLKEDIYTVALFSG